MLHKYLTDHKTSERSEENETLQSMDFDNSQTDQRKKSNTQSTVKGCKAQNLSLQFS